eukprot:6442138-Prorocentrum_lima.AAC.1
MPAAVLRLPIILDRRFQDQLVVTLFGLLCLARRVFAGLGGQVLVLGLFAAATVLVDNLVVPRV